MENKIGYRIRIVAKFDSKGSYVFKDEFFEGYEGAYLLYNFLTLEAVRDAFNVPITPIEAYISLNTIDGNGVAVESKKNKHRLLQRI